MLYGIVIGFYVLACVLLIIVILIQAGRGGGLVEGFSGAESIFGTKTNSFIVKLTAVLGAVFLGSTILLAYLSKTKSKSLLANYKDTPVATSEESKKVPSAGSTALAPIVNPQPAQADVKSVATESKAASATSTNQKTGAQSTQ